MTRKLLGATALGVVFTAILAQTSEAQAIDPNVECRIATDGSGNQIPDTLECGQDADASAPQGTSIGEDSRVNAQYGTAVGWAAWSDAEDGTAIGRALPGTALLFCSDWAMGTMCSAGCGGCCTPMKESHMPS